MEPQKTDDEPTEKVAKLQTPTKGGAGRLAKQAEQSGWTDEQIAVIKDGIAKHGSDGKAVPQIIRDDSKVGFQTVRINGVQVQSDHILLTQLGDAEIAQPASGSTSSSTEGLFTIGAMAATGNQSSRYYNGQLAEQRVYNTNHSNIFSEFPNANSTKSKSKISYNFINFKLQYLDV